MRCSLVSIFLAMSLAAHADISAIYGRYTPTGSTSSSRPEISWKVTPTGGGHVSRVDLRINDKQVSASFDSQSSTVQYTPPEPLSGGIYNVACRVTIERQLIVRQDWTFEVTGSGASSEGSNSTSLSATYALQATNAIRSELGLPPYILDSRISAAADAHSRYQVLNHQTCHIEDPNKPGYTGKAPWDRIQHFGFPGVCYEGACGGQSDPRKGIRLLFDAPYHRIAFLQPGSAPIGIGIQGGALTVDYAVSNDEGVGLSPASGQSGIPVSWDGNESPSPMRVHGGSGPVGYPIVFGWFSPRLEGITVVSMKLFDPAGNLVPGYVNTPANDDELRFAGVLLPQGKLHPGTTYRVEVKASTERGQKIDRTWSFTTAG